MHAVVTHVANESCFSRARQRGGARMNTNSIRSAQHMYMNGAIHGEQQQEQVVHQSSKAFIRPF